jgi:two-component system chemotaxis response regulator CheB
VRVVIADDSPFFREVLKEVLEADGDLQVVGEAGDGREAVRLAEQARADLVTLDLQMPGMGGLEAIEELMARRPVPILVLTSRPAGPGSALLFEATKRGALDILEKKVVGGADTDAGAWLRAHVRSLAAVRVVRRPKPLPEAVAPPLLPLGVASSAARCVVGIGASAGGPPAVAAVLAGLPANFPGCVAVVQHLSPGFASSYASFLQAATALKVEIVLGPVTARPGRVLVAPDGHHLVASAKDRFMLSDAPPDGGHRPSVNSLLGSLASVYGRGAVGVVLSGMGADGARGVALLKAAGALVLAQDEATSIIYGMPKVAHEAGATALPLSAIAGVLLQAVTKDRSP